MRCDKMGIWWVEKFLIDICVYWRPAKIDGYGNAIWEYPIEIKCKWFENQNKTNLSSGMSLGSSSVFYAIYPVLVGGYVFNGRLKDFIDPVTPPYNQKLFGKALEVPWDPWQQKLASQIIEANKMTPLYNSIDFYIRALTS